MDSNKYIKVSYDPEEKNDSSTFKPSLGIFIISKALYICSCISYESSKDGNH